jgi:hypothetical protein
MQPRTSLLLPANQGPLEASLVKQAFPPAMAKTSGKKQYARPPNEPAARLEKQAEFVQPSYAFGRPPGTSDGARWPDDNMISEGNAEGRFHVGIKRKPAY